MNDRKERLHKELEHLEKAHRAGILDDKEFYKGRERIDRKLVDIESQIKHSEEKNQVVSEILESPKDTKVEIVDIPEDTYGVIVDKKDEPINAAPYEEYEKPAVEDPIEEMEEALEEEEPEDEEKPISQTKKSAEDKVKPKNGKKKKQVRKEEGEEEFSWRPVLAVIGFIIIIVGIFMIIRYVGRAPVDLPVEPSFNAMTPTNLSIAVEGVTIPVEVFADYRCAPCKLTRENMKRLQSDFGKSLQVTYRNFPLDANINASLAAECARDQSMFDMFADRLYSSPSSDPSVLKGYAKDLGLNQKAFSACLDNQTTKSRVMSDYALGVSMGVQGTPTVFVNDRQISGYKGYEELKEIIQFQLA